jgi:hypothetical protein
MMDPHGKTEIQQSDFCKFFAIILPSNCGLRTADFSGMGNSAIRNSQSEIQNAARQLSSSLRMLKVLASLYEEHLSQSALHYVDRFIISSRGQRAANHSLKGLFPQSSDDRV